MTITRLHSNYRRGRQAFSLIEYAVMIGIILIGLYVMKDYIMRGYMGRWKAAGDSYGMGRQYNADRTQACTYDIELNKWYDEACFDNARMLCHPGDFECEKGKIEGCSTKACEQ